MKTQYVAVRFREHDKRTYTYTWDGQPFAPGDRVRVPDRSGDGWSAATVASVTDQAPPFACKALLGAVEQPAEPKAGGLFDGGAA